ncbi:MAG: glutaredoxin domain-containing protein [Candidatus Woesearchaeota archaeon]
MIKRYLFFMTPMCPNCADVHEYLSTVHIPGDEIDATEDAGMEVAQKYGVMSVPWVIFLDEEMNVVAHAQCVNDVKKIIENKSLF